MSRGMRIDFFFSFGSLYFCGVGGVGARTVTSPPPPNQRVGRGERRCIRKEIQWFRRIGERFHERRVNKCVAKLKNRKAAGADLMFT